MTQWLYWCTTESGNSDYWVVAESSRRARIFFAGENHYHWTDVKAERIRKKIPQSNPPGEVSVPNQIPSFPTKPLLEKWGVKYSPRFHIFWIGRRIFRPEGLRRALMISTALEALRKRRARGLLSRTGSSL